MAGGAAYYAASFGAISPDAVPATFTVVWTGATCFFMDELGDVLSGADITGGATTFDGHAELVSDTPACTLPIATTHPDDAIWAAISSNASMPTPGFTQSADDGHGDITENLIASSLAGTMVTVSSAGTTGCAMTIVTIKAR